MVEFCMVWRRDDPKQSAIEAVIEGAKRYKEKQGHAPNFLNVPAGFLTDAEVENFGNVGRCNECTGVFQK